MRLCGISSRFQLLSPCTRQVTHALLTRPPLSHKIISPEGNQIKCFVRLACVKHAASVHPEPGSNSHVKKLISVKLSLANPFIQIILNLLFYRSSIFIEAFWLILKIFQGFSLFSYQCSLFALLQQLVHFIKSLFVCQALFYFLNFVLSSLSCDSLFILSKCFAFVKNFFHNFFNLFSKQYL